MSELPGLECSVCLGDHLTVECPNSHKIVVNEWKPVAMVATDNGGLRDSAGKPRYDLIPPEAMEALAAHYAAGATKYADRNWERGMRYGECFRAMMSHAWKWWKGETYDVDPKMPDYKAHHLIAVAWNAIAAYTYEVRKIGLDDRNIVKKDKS